MRKRFVVDEYFNGFELRDTTSGRTHWLGDGVDVFEDMTPGDKGFTARWASEFNASVEETLEAYFGD